MGHPPSTMAISYTTSVGCPGDRRRINAPLAVLFWESDAERYWRVAAHELELFLEEAALELEPVTSDHAQAARRAWRRFGKGNHPAGLNFGDCFAYALAEATREPLLFKGQDFALTDVEAV